MNDKRLYTVRYRFPGTAVETDELPGQLVYAADPGSAVTEVVRRVSKRAGITTNVITVVKVERFSQQIWRLQPPVQAGLL